jgi:hypothetical protein
VVVGLQILRLERRFLAVVETVGEDHLRGRALPEVGGATHELDRAPDGSAERGAGQSQSEEDSVDREHVGECVYRDLAVGMNDWKRMDTGQNLHTSRSDRTAGGLQAWDVRGPARFQKQGKKKARWELGRKGTQEEVEG